MNEKEILEEFDKTFTETEPDNFYSSKTSWKVPIGVPYHVKAFISKALSDQRKEIEKLIVDELLVCHSENTPTSRLTSLMTKMKNLSN